MRAHSLGAEPPKPRSSDGTDLQTESLGSNPSSTTRASDLTSQFPNPENGMNKSVLSLWDTDHM